MIFLYFMRSIQKTIEMDYPFEMIEFREFFAVAFVLKWLSFFVAKSFLYDKEDDCHLEIRQRGTNPLSLISKRESSLSKRRSSLFRRENHPSRNEDHNHIEQTVNHHLEEKSIPSFWNDRWANHFEKRSVISKLESSFISKGEAISFQNDSFAYVFSKINL